MVLPPPTPFPEHPGLAEMHPCLHLLTKRCRKLFKDFDTESWEHDPWRRMSWILSDIGGVGRERWKEMRGQPSVCLGLIHIKERED